MELTKEEAISLVLFLSQDKKVTGKVKLNKLVARLSFFEIPTSISFSLNKFGSHDYDLGMDNTSFYTPYSYQHHGVQTGLEITNKGEELARDTINKKLSSFMSKQEIDALGEEIKQLSTLRAQDISDNEHKKLYVDEDDRHKLKKRINFVHIDFVDLHEDAKKLSSEIVVEADMKALIEYCYYLTKYMKEKRFSNIQGYDFDADMQYYYFLLLFEKKIIPFLKQEMRKEEKDFYRINRLYNFITSESRKKIPFSLDNEHLKELIL